MEHWEQARERSFYDTLRGLHVQILLLSTTTIIMIDAAFAAVRQEG